MALDPETTNALQIVGGSIGGLLVLSYPVMKLVRLWSADRKDGSKDGAESVLYQHLSDQVKSMSDELSKYRNVNSELLAEVSVLRGKVSHLEDVHALNKKLKEKLDQKDEEIANYKIRLSELEIVIRQKICVEECPLSLKDEVKNEV